MEEIAGVGRVAGLDAFGKVPVEAGVVSGDVEEAGGGVVKAEAVALLGECQRRSRKTACCSVFVIARVFAAGRQAGRGGWG